jgi:hypothetical protein
VISYVLEEYAVSILWYQEMDMKVKVGTYILLKYSYPPTRVNGVITSNTVIWNLHPVF